MNSKYIWSEVDRVEPPRRDANDRVGDFREIGGIYDEATVAAQASRCVQCPNPGCVEACPLEVRIPELLSLTAESRFKEAAELLIHTHSFPEVFAAICSGSRLCEATCVLAARSEPLPIGAVTRFLLDYARGHGIPEPFPAPAKGQRIAVVGSGLCGLVAADLLSMRGYAVTVIDSHRKPGGRILNGLPGFRVDQGLMTRRIELLSARGVEFRMEMVCGRDVTLNSLRCEFDAVFFGLGRTDPVPLQMPGAGLQGVYQAHDFVLRNTPGLSLHAPPIDVRGRRVVVLGGGDTAMDAVRVAIRCGASRALCLYRRDRASMPASLEELRLAEEEGAQFQFFTQPISILGDAAGCVTHVRCSRTEPVGCDASGRTNVSGVAGSELDVPSDVLLVAFGFVAPQLPRCDEFAQLATDERGCIVVDENQMTSLPGVFAGGSLVRGQAPLSEFIRDAHRAVAAIDRYLVAGRKTES